MRQVIKKQNSYKRSVYLIAMVVPIDSRFVENKNSDFVEFGEIKLLLVCLRGFRLWRVGRFRVRRRALLRLGLLFVVLLVLLANRCVVLAPFKELLKFFDRLSGSEKSERVSVFNDFDDTIKTRSDSVVSLELFF